MVLSDVDIHRYIAEGKIRVTPPLPPEQFGSCSVDFRLGTEFGIFEHSKHAFIDLRDKTAIQDLMRTIEVPHGRVVHPAARRVRTGDYGRETGTRR